MRVGKKTDYEKINLEITTDGSITPAEAFSKAVKILVDQFSILLKTETKKELEATKEDKIVEVVEKEEIPAQIPEDSKKTEVTDLKGLSTRTLNVLEKSKVQKVGDILKLTEEKLRELDGMGAKGIKEIKKAIGELGFNLKKESKKI